MKTFPTPFSLFNTESPILPYVVKSSSIMSFKSFLPKSTTQALMPSAQIRDQIPQYARNSMARLATGNPLSKAGF